jgi:hypothetical protein
MVLSDILNVFRKLKEAARRKALESILSPFLPLVFYVNRIDSHEFSVEFRSEAKQTKSSSPLKKNRVVSQYIDHSDGHRIQDLIVFVFVITFWRLWLLFNLQH